MKIRRFIFGVLALAVMIGTTGALSSTQAHAGGRCSPPFDTIEEAFTRADIVFKGRIKDVRHPEADARPLVEASWGIRHRVFEIKEIYKAPKEFSVDEIYITLNGGGLDLRIGEELIIYAARLRKEDGLWRANTRLCNRSFYYSLGQRVHNLDQQDINDLRGLVLTGELIKIADRSTFHFKIETLHAKNLQISEGGLFPWQDKPQEFTGDLREGNVIEVKARECDRELRIGEKYFLHVSRGFQVTVEDDGVISGFRLSCGPSFEHSINIDEEKLLKRLSKMSE